MRFSGESNNRTRLVHTDKYVVAVDVEVVIPRDDRSEACLDARSVAFLKEVRERADRDDVNWLRQAGKVYIALDAVLTDDTLTNELLESNAAFQAIVAKSKASPRKSFGTESAN